MQMFLAFLLGGFCGMAVMLLLGHPSEVSRELERQEYEEKFCRCFRCGSQLDEDCEGSPT